MNARAKYLAVYAERFGRVPRRTPEFHPRNPQPKHAARSAALEGIA